MKKKKIIIVVIVIILIILLVPYRKDMLWDGGSVEYKSVLCKYTKVHIFTENYDGVYDGTKIEFLGLKIFDSTKAYQVSILYTCDTHPTGVNDIITKYFANNQNASSNITSWGVDETNSKVIVGMIDISDEKQEEFINTVFENCGTAYIKLLHNKRMIEFKESKVPQISEQ